MNKNLLATVRFYFAQSVFMTNCHYKAYNRLAKRMNRNRYIVIGISVGTLVAIILQTVGLKIGSESLLAILSYCGLILTGSSLIFTMFDREDISDLKNHHRNIAEEFKELRDRYMGLIEDIMNESEDTDHLRKRRDEYQKAYSFLGKYAPPTTYEDYLETQKSLGLSGQKDQEFTWSDKEIDLFLPYALRLENSVEGNA
jgi:hypothetical protein